MFFPHAVSARVRVRAAEVAVKAVSSAQAKVAPKVAGNAPTDNVVPTAREARAASKEEKIKG